MAGVDPRHDDIIERNLLSDLLAAVSDTPALEVTRQLKDRGDRGISLVERSLLAAVTDELLERAVAWAVEADSSGRGDRAVGALVGLAVGDWVGLPLEFLELSERPGDSRWDHDEFTWLNPNSTKLRSTLKRGQFSDDTSMALCLADSIIACRRLDGADIRIRFWSWQAEGLNNTFRFDKSRRSRKSIGLGHNISKSLFALKPGEPVDPVFINPGSSDSGNGGLMRLAPVPIFHAEPDRLEVALDDAGSSSLTTHPGAFATECARLLAFLVHQGINSCSEVRAQGARAFLEASCDAYASRLRALLDNASVEVGDDSALDDVPAERYAREELLALVTSSKVGETEQCWNWRSQSLHLVETFKARGETYNGHPVNRCYAGSYCMDGIAMALHAVATTTSFAAAIERAVNFLGDSDTVGAIAGQIAGSFYGYSSIDHRYIEALRSWDRGEIAGRAVLCFLLGRSSVGAT
mmetsp:Transcript_81570/g.212183  ORF Transcript_81570/g.212183 Transcript_81570/m.212183 type:complete len:466 (+) Transcript_81570:2-1399(+)